MLNSDQELRYGHIAWQYDNLTMNHWDAHDIPDDETQKLVGAVRGLTAEERANYAGMACAVIEQWERDRGETQESGECPECDGSGQHIDPTGMDLGCDSCDGTGKRQAQETQPCPDCHGLGVDVGYGGEGMRCHACGGTGDVPLEDD